MQHQMRSPVFRLIGAERSYFTAKVRPALRAKRIFFEEVPATPEAYREILRRTGLAFIPVVVTPEDETWQDTSEILDALEDPSGSSPSSGATRCRSCSIR